MTGIQFLVFHTDNDVVATAAAPNVVFIHMSPLEIARRVTEAIAYAADRVPESGSIQDGNFPAFRDVFTLLQMDQNSSVFTLVPRAMI